MRARGLVHPEQGDLLSDAESAINRKDYAALVGIGYSLVKNLGDAPHLFDAIPTICNFLVDQEKYWQEVCDLLMGSVRVLDPSTERSKVAMASLVRHACVQGASETESVAVLQFVAARIVSRELFLHNLKMRALGAIVEKTKSWPANERLRPLRNAITTAGIRCAMSQESEPNGPAGRDSEKAIIAAFFEAVGALPNTISRIAIVGNEAELAQLNSAWERTCVAYVLNQINEVQNDKDKAALYVETTQVTLRDGLLRNKIIAGVLSSIMHIRGNPRRLNALASVISIADYPQKLDVLAAYLQCGIALTTYMRTSTEAPLVTIAPSVMTPIIRDARVLSGIMKADKARGWPIAPSVIVYLLERNPVDAPSALVATMLDVLQTARLLREGAAPAVSTVQRVAQFNKKHGRAALASATP